MPKTNQPANQQNNLSFYISINVIFITLPCVVLDLCPNTVSKLVKRPALIIFRYIDLTLIFRYIDLTLIFRYIDFTLIFRYIDLTLRYDPTMFYRSGPD